MEKRYRTLQIHKLTAQMTEDEEALLNIEAIQLIKDLIDENQNILPVNWSNACLSIIEYLHRIYKIGPDIFDLFKMKKKQKKNK